MALEGIGAVFRVARLRRGAAAAAASLALALGCACTTLDAGSPQAPAASSLQVLDRLYFGRAMPQGGEVSDEDWNRFISEVVSPLQPGLTFMPAHGQWRDPSGAVIREEVFVLGLGRDVPSHVRS